MRLERGLILSDSFENKTEGICWSCLQFPSSFLLLFLVDDKNKAVLFTKFDSPYVTIKGKYSVGANREFSKLASYFGMYGSSLGVRKCISVDKGHAYLIGPKGTF